MFDYRTKRISVEIDKFTGTKTITLHPRELEGALGWKGNLELIYIESESESESEPGLNDIMLHVYTFYSKHNNNPYLLSTWNFLIDGSRYSIDASNDERISESERGGGSITRFYTLPLDLLSKMIDAKLVEYSSLGYIREGSFSEDDLLLFKAFMFYIKNRENDALEIIDKINKQLETDNIAEEESNTIEDEVSHPEDKKNKNSIIGLVMMVVAAYFILRSCG
jgi:hypothetical protein